MYANCSRGAGPDHVCQFRLPQKMPIPWLPACQSSPKGEKTCPDSRPTPMQNFMPLAFSAMEKSVTVQTYKQAKKQVRQQASKTHTPPYGLKQRCRPNSNCPLSLATGARGWYVELAAAFPNNGESGSQFRCSSRTNAAPVTSREPIFTKKGRRPVRIVGQQACKISCPSSFRRWEIRNRTNKQTNKNTVN